MQVSRGFLAFTLTASMCCSPSFAQSFNIDVGSLWDGVPVTSYGAATGVTGAWNEVGDATSQLALVDVSGVVTSATISWPVGAYDDGWVELQGATGKLLNDHQLLGGFAGSSFNWSIDGIANGDYRVTFYSRPLDSQNTQGVTEFNVVGGTHGPQSCVGVSDTVFNGFRYGVFMVQDTVTVTNNTLAWNVTLTSGQFGFFDGMQIEKLVAGDVHTYCTAKINSLGCTPTIASSGTPSVTGGAFAVTANNVRSQRSGFLIWSAWQNGMPYQNGTGFLCVSRPFMRTAAQDSNGNPILDDCSGTYSFTWSTAYLALRGLSAGDSVACQYWSIDENAPGGTGLTRGLTFVLAP